MIKAEYADRRFHVWEYRAGHGSLLIRSPKTPETPSNVDLVFVGVEYIAVAARFHGVRIEPASDGDVATVIASYGRVDRESIVVLVSGALRYLVVALDFKVVENDWDIFDSHF